MPQHILIAIDGSEFSTKSARYGLSLAKSLGAKVSMVTVVPTWEAVGLAEIARGHFSDEYAARAKAYGDECLSKGAALAAEAGVPCETFQVSGDRAWKSIIETAREKGADLIVMGAHGRRGVEGLVLGSETVKVLTQSTIPVLVYRE